MTKRKYQQPTIETVSLDNHISLQLASTVSDTPPTKESLNARSTGDYQESFNEDPYDGYYQW